jgi:hypothetical protein
MLVEVVVGGVKLVVVPEAQVVVLVAEVAVDLREAQARLIQAVEAVEAVLILTITLRQLVVQAAQV